MTQYQVLAQQPRKLFLHKYQGWKVACLTLMNNLAAATRETRDTPTTVRGVTIIRDTHFTASYVLIDVKMREGCWNFGFGCCKGSKIFLSDAGKLRYGLTKIQHNYWLVFKAEKQIFLYNFFHNLFIWVILTRMIVSWIVFVATLWPTWFNCTDRAPLYKHDFLGCKLTDFLQSGDLSIVWCSL